MYVAPYTRSDRLRFAVIITQGKFTWQRYLHSAVLFCPACFFFCHDIIIEFVKEDNKKDE